MTGRCTATSKQSGEQCKNRPVAGSTVCRIHGGRAPQVAAAGQRRVSALMARREAQQLLAKIGVTLDTTPIDALLDMLDEAGQNVQAYRLLVEDLPALYGDLYHENGSPTGRALPHVVLTLYNEERDRYSRLAEACAKLGLDERRLRLAEAQVGRLLDAVTGAITDVGMTVEQTGRFKQALAARLRGAL